MTSLQTARSFLFAPGDDERKLARALECGADAVIADLEDAVLPAAKAAARELVRGLIGATTPTECLRLVRVNGSGTQWLADDLSAVAGVALDGVVLPKASPEAVALVARAGLPVVAIAETANGLRNAFEIASAEPVERLVLGAVDLGLELGLEPRSDGQELLFARSSLVVDSAAAQLSGPVDRVWVDIRDEKGLAADCAYARSLGLRGKACIHPAQVPVVNEAFAPSTSELARARAIVAAFDEAAASGRGTVALDGEMIDLPVVERARQLLANDKRSLLNAD
jgi:citrate lyase subunit beta/citryl-CoA lyase